MRPLARAGDAALHEADLHARGVVIEEPQILRRAAGLLDLERNIRLRQELLVLLGPEVIRASLSGCSDGYLPWWRRRDELGGDSEHQRDQHQSRPDGN